jgi:hypothetical protein
MRLLPSLLLAAGCAAQAQSVQLVVQDSPLAGFRHGEAAQLWPQLREGDRLDLVREPDNPHDANAVRVEWQGRKLGYVPRRDNAAVAWGLDRGVRMRARIATLAPHPNPARRIGFEIYIE